MWCVMIFSVSRRRFRSKVDNSPSRPAGPPRGPSAFTRPPAWVTVDPVNVDVTPLPGIGVRKDFGLANGRRVGVVTHRDGTIELIVSKSEDPDACLASLPLRAEEAATLANLLGAPQLVAQLIEEHRDVPGISTRPLGIKAPSPFDGRTLGETALRSRTGVSVVAVMRAGQVHPSPAPDFLLTGGDVLVAVGTSEGLDEAAKILHHG